MFDTLKGWIEHIAALNSIIPGLAQPISWRAGHQKPTFPPKYNYLHLQHYIHPFSWTTEYGPNDFISNKYFRADVRTNFWALFTLFPICTLQLSHLWRTLCLWEEKLICICPRRKSAPAPLYIATFCPTYPNYRKDILRSKQTGCISNPWN